MEGIQMQYKTELLKLKKCVVDIVERSGFVILGTEAEVAILVDEIFPLIEGEIQTLSGNRLFGKLKSDLARLRSLLNKLSTYLAAEADKSIFSEFDAMLENLGEESF